MAHMQDDLDFAIKIGNDPTPSTKDAAPKSNVQATAKTNSGTNEGVRNVELQNQKMEQIDFTNFLQHANNPCVVLFTILFKIAAIVSFFFLGLFGIGEALVFILIVIFGAFDFWFVKNVSGRLLVGLRWWNEVRDDGSEVWIFESDHEVRQSNIDTRIFWFSLYATPVFWFVFLLIEMIGLQLMWALVCLISLVLSGSNMIGYYKCSGEQKKKISNFILTKGTEGITNLFMGGNKN